MASRPARGVTPIDIGVASFASGGQGESGDLHVSVCNSDYALIAAVDGIGHGKSAAAAAHAAASILESSAGVPLVSLIQQCHEVLRSTRGVVLSVAFVDFHLGVLDWIGVGNVQGILLRAPHSPHGSNKTLLLRPGVIGAQFSPLHSATLPISPGDTLAFATDGVRSEFADDLFSHEVPQRSADRILAKHCKGTDDALILVARFLGRSE